jgi:cytidylate kinase
VKVIAIDGPAGSGKSTVARALAERLGLEYLDTGAMYRAVTFAALRRGIDPADAEPTAELARHVELTVSTDGVRVDGVDASIEIRGPEVTRAVSIVAANSAVREELRRRQREWAIERGGGVLEGRDIGTVVFPEADLKVFLTARPDVRAERRASEVTQLDYETVAADLARRDALDQGREDSPLTMAGDAVEIDTSEMSVEQIIDELATLAVTGPSAPAAAGEPAPAAAGEPTTAAEPAAEEEAAAAAEAAPAAEMAAPSGPSRPTKVDPNRAAAVDVHPPKPLERRAYAAVRGLFLGLAKLWFRLEVRGTDRIPAAPFIVAPVHRSNLDFLLAATITKPRMRYMGKASIWKSALLGRFVSMLGAFPVHRGTADRESLRTCLKVLGQGESLVMFPEGTRQSGPKVQDLFDGTAYLALKAGVPVVPLGIAGTEAAMPTGAKVVKPHKVVLVVGEPIVPPDVGGAGRAPRRAVRALTDELHTAIQGVFDEATAALD